MINMITRVENKRTNALILTERQTPFTTNTMGSRRMSGHYRPYVNPKADPNVNQIHARIYPWKFHECQLDFVEKYNIYALHTNCSFTSLTNNEYRVKCVF